MPYVDGVYTPFHNFQEEYSQGQKQIRADYMDDQFNDLATVLSGFFTDVEDIRESCSESADSAARDSASINAKVNTAYQQIDSKVSDATTFIQSQVDTVISDAQDYAESAAQSIVNDCVRITGDNTVLVDGNTISVSNGTCFTKTISQDTTFTFDSTNIGSGKCACFSMILTNGGNYTVSWPSSVKWEDGKVPELTKNGIDVLVFLTPNGGTNWYGTQPVIDAYTRDI